MTQHDHPAGQTPAPSPGSAIGGPCNRAACQTIGATWWNTSTRAWYCERCATLINDGHQGLCLSPDDLPCEWRPIMPPAPPPVDVVDRIRSAAFVISNLDTSHEIHHAVEALYREAFAAGAATGETFRNLASDGRASGRAEAVAILLEQSAEDFMDEMADSHSIGDTGDYGVHWLHEKVYALFNVKPGNAMASVLGAFLRSLNDRLSDEHRQRLKPLIPKLVGTNTGPDDDRTRALLAADYTYRVTVPFWLGAAGMSERATALRSLPEITSLEQLAGMVPMMRTTRDEARERRWTLLAPIKEKVIAAVKAKFPAAAAAAADAAADAAAAADAVAAAVAAADAVAAAAAAAAADAVAAADAAAVAAADADAAAGRYWHIRNAVYEAVRKVFREKIGARIEAKNAEHIDGLIALAERMIAVGKK